MGEYATNKRTGERFKMGVCNDMYYVRYEQRAMFDYDYPTDNFRWRIPTPDEDSIEMGCYDYSLCKDGDVVPPNLAIDTYELPKDAVKAMQENDYPMQLSEGLMGLQVKVRCPHGLPFEGGAYEVDCQPGRFLQSYGYNSFPEVLYLAALKNTAKDLLVCVKCRCCAGMWSFSLPEILPVIKSLWMQLRLLHQCSEYWYERNDEPFNATVKSIDFLLQEMSITAVSAKSWVVQVNGMAVCAGTWEKCRNCFIRLLPRRSDIAEPLWQLKEEDKVSQAIAWSESLSNRYLYGEKK